MKIRLEDGTGLDLKYLVSDTDRHGNARIYVRRHGCKVRVRDLGTVEEFMAAYRAALGNCCRDLACDTEIFIRIVSKRAVPESNDGGVGSGQGLKA